MPPSCIVFDFDGTLTDPRQVAAALQRATRLELARRLAVDEAVMSVWWTEATAQLELAPASEAWQVEGRAVVSIRADLYVWTNAITRRVLERHGLSTEQVDVGVVETHWAAHGATPAPFRQGVGELLDSLVSAGKHVFVVTNSDGELVNARLDALGLAHRRGIRVLGRANKHVIGPPSRPSATFDRLPESMSMPGLGRPVLLRRGCYFDKLAELWSLCSVSAEETVVCGDIFEIDLSLPAALGCQTLLVAGPDTPDYERAIASSLPAGSVGDSPACVLELVGEKSESKNRCVTIASPQNERSTSEMPKT